MSADKNVDWFIREVPWPSDVTAAVRAFAGEQELAWLDSATTPQLDTTPARYSLICRDPIAILSQYDGRAAEFRVKGNPIASDGDGWRLWRRANAILGRHYTPEIGMTPGWVGYIGFEMARQLERLPASNRGDFGLPLLRMGLFDRGIVLDHHSQTAHAVSCPGVRTALNLEESTPGVLLDDWQQAIDSPVPSRRIVLPSYGFEMPRVEYERIVTRALEYIAAGDIYQVNLAQRLRFRGIADQFQAYARLRTVNPAPYAAFLRWSDGAIGSVSPELFLRLDGRDVLTQPIKGTRPRTHDPIQDEANQRELLDSAKDAAELAMIIDLHRNDLGRVCEYGSVRVLDPRHLEAHPTVFHTVGDICGTLRPDRDEIDLLCACFPAGSISGVPKIRAMEIIDELEPYARGAYTGAVGVLGLDRRMIFNVAIRTVQFSGREATLYVGGGIVADSKPAEEYAETLAKARGIVNALSRSTRGEEGVEPGLPLPDGASPTRTLLPEGENKGVFRA